MKRTPGFCFLLALICSTEYGCIKTGRRIEDTQLAQSPRGATGWIQVRGEGSQLDIELLAVSDSSVMVETREGRIAEALFKDVRALNLRDVGVFEGGQMGSRRSRIALRSRFPFGFSDDVRAQLLARAGQVAIVRLGTQR